MPLVPPRPSEVLPGKAELDESPTPASYKRIGTVMAQRLAPRTLVRGKNSVELIHDGWLVIGEDGYPFGVEDSEFLGRFTVTTHTIGITVGANGSADPATDATVDDQGELVITVTPDAGYLVDAVTVDGDPAVLTDGTYTFSGVDSDHTFAVTFVAE